MVNGAHSEILTALQLKGAHLSIHRVLSQIHVAGDRSRDAVGHSKQAFITKLEKPN